MDRALAAWDAWDQAWMLPAEQRPAAAGPGPLSRHALESVRQVLVETLAEFDQLWATWATGAPEGPVGGRHNLNSRRVADRRAGALHAEAGSAAGWSGTGGMSAEDARWTPSPQPRAGGTEPWRVSEPGYLALDGVDAASRPSPLVRSSRSTVGEASRGAATRSGSMSSTEVGPVRVGVTGHRLLADVTMVQRGVRRAVDAIRGAYPGRPLTVISALAEGADRLVAQEVMRTPGARLMAILPFAPDRYARDFGALGSPSRVAFEELLGRAYQVHLVPGELPAEFAYQRAGWHIADHCDVLLAVWDGKPQLGRGGTAEIVSRARGLGKPIVIVAAGNRQPGTNDPTSLGSDQGQVFLEGIPSTG